MQNLPLWPTHFYDFQWPEHDRYRRDLVRICHEQQAQKRTSGVATEAKSNLYESGFDFLTLSDPAVVAFGTWIKHSFYQAAADANKKHWPAGMRVAIEVHESWCHITRDGGYHDMHVHPNSSWSAIYYLDTGDMDPATKNGVNRFFNPTHTMYSDAGTAWMAASTSIDFRAEPGMMIVFPSWIQHNAVTYQGTKERIVIAANCRINRVA